MNIFESKHRQFNAKHIHSERDRKTPERRLADGIVFDKLAEGFDMSDNQIKRIVYKLQEQLFKQL